MAVHKNRRENRKAIYVLLRPFPFFRLMGLAGDLAIYAGLSFCVKVAKKEEGGWSNLRTWWAHCIDGVNQLKLIGHGEIKDFSSTMEPSRG